jgi:sensor c-di-GMP phosphodiesterase-like protein
MQSAEVALSRAKMQGRGGKVIFAASMQEHSWKNIRLYNSLQQAINQSQFTLHYQPLIDLASNRITSLEALIRWPDPAGGFVPPMEFIPFAETSGQINAISQWVVETAFAQKMDWHRQGLSAVDIAINLSGQMLDSDQVIPLFEKNRAPERSKMAGY